MITESVRISDKFQIEIKLGYDLRHEEKHTSYTVEIYLFLPSSLGLHIDTYPKYLFYRDIQTYIRFMTPEVLLNNVSTVENSPLQILKNSLQDLVREKSRKTIKHFDNQNKMFCCIFRASLRRHVNLIHNCQNDEDIGILVEQYLANVPRIVHEFRKLRKLTNSSNIDEQQQSTYMFSDEYVSLTVEQLTFGHYGRDQELR
ncbi:MAG: hypothetical protein EP297_05075 [Gammaproteobacteria bacterium]|nr:MAG: hypothetical protein EP297_05075 [Gammaproteobacteria bacterium]